jgi:hypothetical protein
MDDVAPGKTMAWKVPALLCAIFLLFFIPAGCGKKPAEDGGNAVQADKLKSSPSAPEQNGAGNPQASPGVKAAPENGSKPGEEEDQEEPESEPDDE